VTSPLYLSLFSSFVFLSFFLNPGTILRIVNSSSRILSLLLTSNRELTIQLPFKHPPLPGFQLCPSLTVPSPDPPWVCFLLQRMPRVALGHPLAFFF
jgi:hypothetical protein